MFTRSYLHLCWTGFQRQQHLFRMTCSTVMYRYNARKHTSSHIKHVGISLTAISRCFKNRFSGKPTSTVCYSIVTGWLRSYSSHVQWDSWIELKESYRRSLRPVSSAPPCDTPPAPGLSAGWRGWEALALVALWVGWLETNRWAETQNNCFWICSSRIETDVFARCETAVYRRTVDCYDAGEDLRLRSCCLHVLTILLSDLRRRTVSFQRQRSGLMGDRRGQEQGETLPCFVSRSPLEGWWKEAQTGLGSLSWWLCCRPVSAPQPSTTKGKTSKQCLIIHFYCKKWLEL